MYSTWFWPEPVRSRLTQYYTRYYRDALGIPGWRDLVAARLGEESYEAGHLARTAGRIPRRTYATPSTPNEGLPDLH